MMRPMSEPHSDTDLTGAETERERPSSAPADTDDDGDLQREAVDEELKGYPDQPTTS
jgi:hypothetical protein